MIENSSTNLRIENNKERIKMNKAFDKVHIHNHRPKDGSRFYEGQALLIKKKLDLEDLEQWYVRFYDPITGQLEDSTYLRLIERRT